MVYVLVALRPLQNQKRGVVPVPMKIFISFHAYLVPSGVFYKENFVVWLQLFVASLILDLGVGRAELVQLSLVRILLESLFLNYPTNNLKFPIFV